MEVQRPKRIVVVRHGQSESNVIQQRLLDQGEDIGYPDDYQAKRDCDIPLTQLSHEQSRMTGMYLSERFGVFAACYVSPFLRTKQTFEGIVEGYPEENREAIKAALQIDSRLREKDHGAVTFLTKPQVEQLFPLEFQRREREGKFLYRPLGGESWYDLKDLRIGGILNRIYRDHAGESVLIVSHSVVITCLRWKLEHLEETQVLEIVESSYIQNCAIALFEYDGAEGRLVLKEWNTRAPGLPDPDNDPNNLQSEKA